MAKGRKNGCPVNIRNWLVYIQTGEDEWTRIYGLTSLTRNLDSETEDGSAETDEWAEPYVTKRSGSLSLEGRQVINEVDGENDPGQEALDGYAEATGCEADATLKFIDPYGHAWMADYIVTSRETSADDGETTLSWDLDQVGKAEVIPYVNATAIALKDGAQAATTLSLKMGSAGKLITVAFTPTNTSNTRFRVRNSKRAVALVSDITETGFTVTPVSVGTTTITVTSASGAKTATMTVTVTA